MIIEWTSGAFQQLRRYYDTGHIWTQSGGITALASGLISISFTEAAPKITFSESMPGIDFTASRPTITFEVG